MPIDRAVWKKESAAILQAGLLAGALFCWTFGSIFLLLKKPSDSVVVLMMGCAAAAWVLSLSAGFRAPAETKKRKWVRAIFVGPSGLVATLSIIFGSAIFFSHDTALLSAMATVGSLLVGTIRWRLRDRAAARTPKHAFGRAFAWMGAIVLTLVVTASSELCLAAWLRYGLTLHDCPDGKIHQTLIVNAAGMQRGAEGSVNIHAIANYTSGAADAALTATIPSFDAKLFLVDPNGKESVLSPNKDGWRSNSGVEQTAQIALPKDIGDGDYVLRTRVHSRVADGILDVPLAVYAPARIHVITDRPLYEPGNTVQFRAVALRATDFAPLDGRPGKWIVQDPSGETVLEEKAVAGDFGVVAGSFPLDSGAQPGDWKVRWVSGGTEDSVGFAVRPFTMPRFRVEAAAAKPFYGKNERPIVRGKVLYSSGAPVRGAEISLRWSVEGEWPAPPDWEDGGLPNKATSGAAGTFELLLPVVPQDLRGRATLHAILSVTDATGDRVASATSVLLSEDAIEVSALTELEGGLVPGFNNRLYLRATSAGGAVLANTELLIKRAWDLNDSGVKATTDADGVAAMQLDPGPPVNVVVPPMPVRRASATPAVARGETQELITGNEPSVADRLAMDRWNNAIAPCGRFVAEPDAGQDAVVAFRANAAGSIVATASAPERLARCVAGTISGQHLSAGAERIFQVTYTVTSNLPRLTFELSGGPDVPEGLSDAFRDALQDARLCLPKNAGEASFPRVVVWNAKPAKKSLSLSFVADPEKPENPVAASVAACVEHKLASITWSTVTSASNNASEDDDTSVSMGALNKEFLGVVHINVEPSGQESGDDQAEATTRLGYELSISARSAQETIGATHLVLDPGKVPPIRLRADPVLATAGENVEVRLLRGPDFSGELPKELTMSHHQGSIEAKLDRDTLCAHFILPADAKGWFKVEYGGGRTLVYVRPKTELAVSVEPGAERYAPGDLAELRIHTTSGNRPAIAAVGLFGVDASLAQLVSLPGPDDMSRIRPKATMDSPAFGVLDATALEMGRIHGANAAAATVLRVRDLPAPETLDALVAAGGASTFEPLEALTDNFYRALDELRSQVRAWEAGAPKGEKMRPAAMAKLWDAALAECEKRKEPVTDAYGRRLRLHQLPGDLLALADPRALVMDGTRLPEDVENWAAWVGRERP